MKILATDIEDVFVVETNSLIDVRGTFTRFYCKNELEAIWGNREIEQINRSITTKIGAVRGMHFQHPPFAEMKIVRCLNGRVFDVAVDLREGSKTFLKWHAQELSASNNLMLVIPEGCAHGFQVLEPNSELLYLHSAKYAPLAEGGLRFDDPELNIAWPLPVTDLSERDKGHQLLNHKPLSLII
jgi:dTDP-4-dehydrorhamnose 3,5-epimerase